MGCKQSSELDSQGAGQQEKKVDPRLPFERYRQLFTLRNHWKTISRKLDDTAKNNLLRHFKSHPEYQDYHASIKDIKDEEQLRHSEDFQNEAVDIFEVFDETMENTEKVDTAIMVLENMGSKYQKKGFKIEYFKDMEASFISSCGEALEDRFTDATEDSFRKYYGFMLKYITEGFTKAENTI